MTIVSERALAARVDRALAREYGHRLRRIRWGASAQADLGRYYSVDMHCNSIGFMHIDLEDMARQLGALQPEEQMA
ncbi:hypothetical protein ACIPRI_12575 [Variovorax sp. LARHSF232]